MRLRESRGLNLKRGKSFVLVSVVEEKLLVPKEKICVMVSKGSTCRKLGFEAKKLWTPRKWSARANRKC